MYVHMYVCMCVYACMYACMHACRYVSYVSTLQVASGDSWASTIVREIFRKRDPELSETDRSVAAFFIIYVIIAGVILMVLQALACTHARVLTRARTHAHTCARTHNHPHPHPPTPTHAYTHKSSLLSLSWSSSLSPFLLFSPSPSLNSFCR